MKKNKMMRLASILLVCVLLSTSMISGTFAKYTTSIDSSDTARVAYWGFQSTNSMDLSGLFAASYDNVKAENLKDVMAPGTQGSAKFQFAYDENVTVNGSEYTMKAPEVAYNFTITVEASCDELIKNNKNIVWKLDKNGGEELTWEEFVKAIVKLSGTTAEVTYVNNMASATVKYEAGTLPEAFATSDTEHTIYWEWKFGDEEHAYKGTYDVNSLTMTQDEYDTYMGNMDEMDDVSIKITITATQIK